MGRGPKTGSMPLFCRKGGGESISLLLLGSPILPATILLRYNPEITPPPARPATVGAHNPTIPTAGLPIFSALTRSRFWWVRGGLLPEEQVLI